MFDKIWIDCLNGDKYKTGKLTPDGKPDPSIFSTEHNREGIQVGTAIALLTRKEEHQPADAVSVAQFWGVEKRSELAELATGRDEQTSYEVFTPSLDTALSLLRGDADTQYFAWPLLTDLFPASFSAVQTKRDELVVDIDDSELRSRMQAYFDPTVGDAQMAQLCPRALQSTPYFDPSPVRRYLVGRGLLQRYFVRYLYRPFDHRWCYWEPETALLGRRSPDYFPQVFAGNMWILTTGRTRKSDPEPAVLTRELADLNYMDSGTRATPLLLDEHLRQPNVSERASRYLGSLAVGPEQLMLHCAAVTQSVLYRRSNSAGLRNSWPRIPLPDSKELLLASAELGRKVADLLDPETEVDGVTGGNVRPELRVIGAPTRTGGRPLNHQAGDLAVTAGWGHAGQGGVTMPGKGKINTRPWTADERTAIEQGAGALGLSAEQALAQLGEQAVDVYLNDVAYWRGVPAGVWSYTIGGYQVMKKWLSYREKPLLGRDLKPDEVREVQAMARRIAAILLLQPALDANYRAVKDHTYEWGK